MDEHSRGPVPLEEQDPLVILDTDVVRLVEDARAGRHQWWLFFERLRGAGPLTRHDLGTRELPPQTYELDQLLASHGLTTTTSGWSELAGVDGERYQRARVTTFEARQRERERQAAEGAERDGHSKAASRAWTIGLAVVAGLLLLVAAIETPTADPGPYFRWLRILIPLSATALAVLLIRSNEAAWLIGLIPAALIWNPIIPLYLQREEWLPLDLAGAALFGSIAFWKVWSKRARPS